MTAIDTIEKSPDLPLDANKPKKRGSIPDTKTAKERAEKSKLSPNTGKRGKLKTTLLKEEVYKQMQQTLLERTMGLINTQTVIAHGTIKVFKIISKTVGSGKNARTIKEKPELVTDTDEIADVIGYQYGNGADPSDDETYYFVTTQDPDNGAIKDQINRIFGKPDGKIDVTSGGNPIKTISIIQPND